MLFYTYKRPTILVVIGAIARPKAFLVLTNVSEKHIFSQNKLHDTFQLGKYMYIYVDMCM